MNSLLASIIATVLGSTLIINGLNVRVDDILDSAKLAVNQTNVYQLDTALELYYSDHNAYPDVSTGTALVDLLESEGYITSRPLDPGVYEYTLTETGGYKLVLK